MGTKRSSGTQHNPKGVNQGVTLVDPVSGDPIDTIEDSNGVKRLAVDGNFVAQNVQANVNLDSDEDEVAVEDPDTGAHIRVESDGSINANVEVDATDGDNIGLKVQDRTLTPGDTNYTKRVTAKTGTGPNADTTSMDVSVHDHQGNEFTDANPLKTSDLATRTVIQNELDATQALIQAESDQTQTILQTEFDATQALIQSEFDESQVKQDATNTKLDTLNATVQSEFDATQSLIQTEFDQTQVKQDLTNTKLDALTTVVQNESDATQTILQTEFDQTQVAIVNLQTVVQNEFDATQILLQTEHDQTQAILQSEFDATQSLLQTEFDQTQVKLDTLKTEFDDTQTLLQTEFDQTQVKLDTLKTEFDDTQTLLQTEFDQTQTAITNLQTEVDAGQYTMNEAFNKAAAIAGQLDDTGTTAATENNIAPVRITAQRALHSNLRDAAGNALLGRKTAELSIPVVEAENQTYSAAASGFVSAASATDVFIINGSVSKTIRITKVRVTASTTSGSAIKLTVQGIKRSTADTAGTAVTATNVPHDSTNAAATAVVRHFTANPTLGTAVGTMRTTHVGVTQSGLSGGAIEWDFEKQPVVLRGVAQGFAVNFNSITVSGSIVSIHCEWVEV